MTDPTTENGEIETDFEVGQDNIDGSLGPIGFDIHNPVFVAADDDLSRSSGGCLPRGA